MHHFGCRDGKCLPSTFMGVAMVFFFFWIYIDYLGTKHYTFIYHFIDEFSTILRSRNLHLQFPQQYDSSNDFQDAKVNQYIIIDITFS